MDAKTTIDYSVHPKDSPLLRTLGRDGSTHAHHGVENPDIRYRDSLSHDHSGDEEALTVVLANPPFAGSLDYENTAKDLLDIVKTNSGGTDQVGARCVQILPRSTRRPLRLPPAPRLPRRTLK